ncbi:MAG TPA: N-acetylmuramoyl-L-alanine amidase [Clostridiales bacterium]|nr:N-acetylmuramoyl-L-alanine amidase [Clostridiales bacterium]
MGEILTKAEWKRRRKIKNLWLMVIVHLLGVFIVAFFLFISVKLIQRKYNPIDQRVEEIMETLSDGIIIRQHYLSPNEYSRPQTSLNKIKGVVVHYTANPGTSAVNNRNYFQSLAATKTTYASSHYIIGLEGEIVQCIPLTEISYASNHRNQDTISIECCHPDETGKFNQETYDSLVFLVAALSYEFNLDEDDIIRHYDVTGKMCPLYFVEHEDEWLSFKKDVMDTLNEFKARKD